ncbi:putative cyclin-A3-1 [Zea mays]|uniref:Putative cyclin-A3-1 n=1 Tax=Zea mays TaxID=4577 RepID=A0A3L6DDH5_MAIZE|nr:hypothetical protein Zm00014a_016332 [Zea mays]PWZ06636.1 putative cyclin-A3-1 [Zea mays]
MKRKENSEHSAPPLNRPRGKRKALAELPKSNGLNMNHDSAPRPSKPRTRSAARAEAEAEAAMKRRKAGDAARWPMDTRQPDVEAAVAPYVGDIDRYLRSLEVEPLRRPSHSYFQDIQKDICPKMRAILVDCKYEEIESSKMKVKRYTDITDNTYTKQQIGGPTVTTFLRQFIASCRGGNVSGTLEHVHLLLLMFFFPDKSVFLFKIQSASRGKLEFVCSYLAELSLLDYDCISYLPSVVAAACLFVARFIIHPKTRPWNLSLEQSTGYRVFDLQKSIYVIHELQLTIRCPNQVAIREKYKDPKFGCVSTMVSPREIPTSFLEDCHK